MKMHKIFSKTPLKKEIPKVKITIDSMEKQSLTVAELLNQKANISFERLEIGDYLIKDTIIERKTISDFISSMINKRLLEQLANIKKYPNYYLILEGSNYDYTKFNVHENAVRGMLLSIALDFKVPIIFTENERDTANFLILTARRYEKSKTPKAIRRTKNSKTEEEQKQFILQGFPGIGPTISKKLIKKFKSLQEIFNSPEEKLKQIKNFDKNKIKNFLNILK